MSNQERITCDYIGCDKPFAYMLGPFRLCIRHLEEGESRNWKDRMLEYFEKGKKDATSTNQ